MPFAITNHLTDSPQRQFQCSAGTVPGRRHTGNGNLLGGKNNQDAFGIYKTNRFLLATVHDGCSSGSHSEIGAWLAPKLLAGAFEKAFAKTDTNEPIHLLALAQQYFLDAMENTIRLLLPASNQQEFQQTTADYFLFTTVGALLTADYCLLFACGDGLYCLNGRLVELGPYPGNAPPYSAYSLLPQHQVKAETLPVANLQALELLGLSEVASLVLGTDGARDLLASADKKLPGKRTNVGPLSQIWTEDRFFDESQSNLLTPWLRQINSEVTKISQTASGAELKRHYGLLEDDTTLVVLRRSA